MSLLSIAIAGSVFPAYLQCTALRTMPLYDPVEKLTVMFADHEFTFDPKFADLLGIQKATGKWGDEGWALNSAGPTISFRATLMPSRDDKMHWGMDWRATSIKSKLITSSGVADCRLIDPQIKGLPQ